jgi:hypothetical protein
MIGVGIARCVMDAHAQDAPSWEPKARQCTERVSKELGGCGSCSGAWEKISQCTVHDVAPEMPQWIVDTCLWSVRNRTGNEFGAYDRVGAVLACVTRRPAH